MIYEFIRTLTCDFDQIKPFVPSKGFILDVGCGHGIFARKLAQKAKQSRILGIDPAEKKIAAAKNSSLKVPNLKFQRGYLKDISGKKFECISIIDVLYLLPTKEKLSMLLKCKSLLKKGGKLLLVINGKEPSWIFKILEIEEKIMINLLKFTYSDYKKTFFLDKNSYKRLLTKAGFLIENEVRIRSFLPYPHLLLVATPV